jgi:hypothetical protein
MQGNLPTPPPSIGATRHKVFAADEHDPDLASRLVEETLAAELNVVAMYTRFVPTIMAQLRQFARRSAQSLYAWNPDEGLSSLREDDIVVPGSKRLADALRHMFASAHFGVYVIPNIAAHLTGPLTAQLRNFSRNRTSAAERRLLLLEARVDLPAALGENCAHLLHQPRSAGRLRLRDGRWVR